MLADECLIPKVRNNIFAFRLGSFQQGHCRWPWPGKYIHRTSLYDCNKSNKYNKITWEQSSMTWSQLKILRYVVHQECYSTDEFNAWLGILSGPTFSSTMRHCGSLRIEFSKSYNERFLLRRACWDHILTLSKETAILYQKAEPKRW